MICIDICTCMAHIIYTHVANNPLSNKILISDGVCIQKCLVHYRSTPVQYHKLLRAARHQHWVYPQRTIIRSLVEWEERFGRTSEYNTTTTTTSTRSNTPTPSRSTERSEVFKDLWALRKAEHLTQCKFNVKREFLSCKEDWCACHQGNTLWNIDGQLCTP